MSGRTIRSSRDIRSAALAARAQCQREATSRIPGPSRSELSLWWPSRSGWSRLGGITDGDRCAWIVRGRRLRSHAHPAREALRVQVSQDLHRDVHVAVSRARLNSLRKISALDDAHGVRHRAAQAHDNPRLSGKANLARARRSAEDDGRILRCGGTLPHRRPCGIALRRHLRATGRRCWSRRTG